MALTEAQKLIVRGAKLMGADRDDAAGILLALRDPEQQEDLLDWMEENLETATPSDLLGKTMDIVAGRN
jgi:hypothetical protein